MNVNPANYEAWYHTKRGNWIADREFSLMIEMLNLQTNDQLLDVGCGTGYFSRRFASYGANVTGIDPDKSMLAFARQQPGNINYIEATADQLPFDDKVFDYSVAVTSFCFINDPAKALSELLRVSRKGVLLGLLNRKSLLYYQKHGKGAYQGARWDDSVAVKQWLKHLNLDINSDTYRTAVFIPSASFVAKQIERVIPVSFPYGSFLAVSIKTSLTV